MNVWTGKTSNLEQVVHLGVWNWWQYFTLLWDLCLCVLKKFCSLPNTLDVHMFSCSSINIGYITENALS